MIEQAPVGGDDTAKMQGSSSVQRSSGAHWSETYNAVVMQSAHEQSSVTNAHAHAKAERPGACNLDGTCENLYEAATAPTAPKRPITPAESPLGTLRGSGDHRPSGHRRSHGMSF